MLENLIKGQGHIEQLLNLKKKLTRKSLIFRRPSPLMTGLGMGIAANSLIIALGLYFLLNALPSKSEQDVLGDAQEEYETGDIEKAIALAQSIPESSPIYPEAQSAILEWKQHWSSAKVKFQAVEKAFNEGRWLDVVEEAHKIPNISFWQEKLDPLLAKAKLSVQTEEKNNFSVKNQAKELLQKAYDRAQVKDFSGALIYLKQISPNTPIGKKVEEKLQEYTQKQEIRANYLLNEAYKQAGKNNFSDAINALKQISEDSPGYIKAQAKIMEYTKKQLLQPEEPIVLKSRDSSLTKTLTDTQL